MADILLLLKVDQIKISQANIFIYSLLTVFTLQAAVVKCAMLESGDAEMLFKYSIFPKLIFLNDRSVVLFSENSSMLLYLSKFFFKMLQWLFLILMLFLPYLIVLLCVMLDFKTAKIKRDERLWHLESWEMTISLLLIY